LINIPDNEVADGAADELLTEQVADSRGAAGDEHSCMGELTHVGASFYQHKKRRRDYHITPTPCRYGENRVMRRRIFRR